MKACFVVACIFLVLNLYAFQGNFPTLGGDNLYATPWQRWNRGPLLLRSISRAKQILHCADVRHKQCLLDEELQKLPRIERGSSSEGRSCPSYFKWIEKDLRPWSENGISKWSLDVTAAAFRVTIVDGRAYVKHYYNCHFGRSMFTVWGLLMLLERFPGRISDVDLIFNCADRPRVSKRSWTIPPLIGYSTSSNNESLDIPFPDWSFWGWPEMGIDSWEKESFSIVQGAKQLPWKDRMPFAQWKGNMYSSKAREHLQRCNSSRLINIYNQNWQEETRNNFTNSHRSKQCMHRYKLYAEGFAWSASYKYILACGSTMLNIDQEYQDFFTRALIPWFHYVPVSHDPKKMCSSIEKAVEWGNAHPEEAEAIGRHGQDFIMNELSMDHVYDYMYHLLDGYAKLQKFQPVVPQGAEWVCPSSVRCIADPSERELIERLERPAPGHPCTIKGEKADDDGV